MKRPKVTIEKLDKISKYMVQIATEEPHIRRGGQLKGLIQISDDFDTPLPEAILKYFYEDEK